MIPLTAGFIAAALAWGGNLLIVKRWDEAGIIWGVPIFEEFVKTMSALFFGVSIVFVHSVFGLIEAGHDYFTSRRGGVWSALAAFVSHWIFGLVTFYTLTYTRFWLVSIVTAALLHTYFNYIMVKFLKTRYRHRP